jgi:large conductance mechanosensitive channel
MVIGFAHRDVFQALGSGSKVNLFSCVSLDTRIALQGDAKILLISLIKRYAVMANGYNRARGFLDDFKEFLMKGNVLDLAVAVVIGAAFGKIISSLVENIVMPIVSLAIPGGEWRTAKIVLGRVADPKDPSKTVENAILLGQFFGTIVDFALISLAIFLIIRAVEAAKRKTARQEAIAETVVDPAAIAQANLISSLDRLTHTLESQNR